ncbi:hypothetical protein F5X97DRAFT_322951 [Nemania serpens]|nr:hypothetical protein F5X97DRAFT_322951 [Nemania serpens]
MGVSQNYLPEPEGLYTALDELDKNIIPATLDSLYDFFPAMRNSETLIAGESKAFKTRLQQIRNKTKKQWQWPWALGGSSWSSSQEQEFRALLRKLCDRVDSIIEPREKESVQVKMALQNMKSKITTVRDQMIHNQRSLQSAKEEKRDKFLGKWRFSDQLDRISSSIESLDKTQETVSEGVTVVAGIINFVGGIRGEMRALRAIANSADLQFGEESIDGLILSLELALNAFHARLNSKLRYLVRNSITMPKENAQKGGKKSQEREDDMFVLVDKKNPIVKDGKLVSSWDDPRQDDKQGKSAKKADDGFERVPVFGGNPDQRSRNAK